MEVGVELELPDNVARYFAAQNDKDADGMTECFAPNAVVRDEGHTYVGRDAIRDWKLDTIAKYGVSVLPFGSTDSMNGLEVVAKVEGNFPGSPVDLTYDFVLDAYGLIHALEIR
jgi:hypothetical protein